ncbi:MAG: hypothetical protein WAT19_07730 [Ferruginibacter sp.]
MKKLITLSLIILFISCSKSDLTNQNLLDDTALNTKFFQALPETNPIVLKVMKELQIINSEQNFVNEFSKTNGFPVWEKALISAPSGQDTFVYIPTVIDKSKQTNGFIRAVLNDGIIISSGKASDYSTFSFYDTGDNTTANHFASLFMFFDSKIFGASNFTITDNRLFSDDVVNSIHRYRQAIKLPPNTSSLNLDCTMVTEYTEWLVQDPEHCTCVNKASCDWATGCTACSNTYSITFTYGIGDCGGGSTPVIGTVTWNPGPPGTGGGGSTSSSPTQLAWFPIPEACWGLASQLNGILQPFDAYSFQDGLGFNTPSFNTVSELNTYINSNTQTFDYSLPPLIINQNEKTERARVNFGLGGGVDINVKLVKNSGIWSVSDVTSSDWGLTFSWSWSHSHYTTNSNGSETIIDVYGYINYNIFVEGIGTIYKEFTHYQIKVNNTTGAITSITKI